MKQLPDRLRKFLKTHSVLTLAVVAANDRPHAAALFYAVDPALNFYVLTDPATEHGQAMQRRRLVAGTVQRDRQRWTEIQGVQFRGRCRKLTGQERARAWQLYVARFPFLKKAGPTLARQLEKTALWRITPVWMRLIDNRRGFGHKEEWRA